MPLWEWVVDVLGGLLLLLVLYAVALVLRRRWISRDGGTFELSHRVVPEHGTLSGRGWVLGVGRYSGDLLEFFRIFSLSPRPRRVLDRGRLSYDGTRAPSAAESHSLYAGHVVVGCRSATETFELAMSQDAVTGFLSWLEAAPPGSPPRPR
ncbi:MAG: hypothetical protein AVDCRST_MAG34-335 [uncultured Nocardioidaceae bacterium]|uniref:Secreted/membrane protein n=1 Tax=uncultured Nocardioidaceae bacterium TaxID=253824 RepID=A0A6J4L8V7_9ACTN|nr:MAG: hypothetical protein AVDCRST_MAG34-335 [uncultured Nocardioidaceae bacterium]